MHNDCAEVDELLLALANYKNDYADVAAEKLLLRCSTSWEAYQYLQDRVHDAWIPDSARDRPTERAKGPCKSGFLTVIEKAKTGSF